MAITILTNPVSGKQGSTVYSRNRYGAYMRALVKPINPSTNPQEAARQRFTTSSTRWKGVLSESQRDSWRQYAAQTPTTNRLGAEVFLTGHAWFVAYYSFTRQFSQAFAGTYNAPPELPGVGGALILDPASLVLRDKDSASPNELDVIVSGAGSIQGFIADNDNTGLRIGVSAPRSPGVNFIKGPYLVPTGGLIKGDATTPPGPTVTISLPFEVPAASKVGLTLRAISANGLITPTLLTILTAVNVP